MATAQPVISLPQDRGAGVPTAMPLQRLGQRALAALVVAATVVLPLVFVPSLDDGYALPKVSVLRVVGLVGATLFFAYVAWRGTLTRNADPRTDVPLACFAALLVAASLASVDPLQSFSGEIYQYQGLITVLVYIGSFVIARLSLGSPKGFRTVLAATVATGALVSVYGVAQALGVDPFLAGPDDEGRIISSVGQANNLAAYLDLVVIAAAGLWPMAGRRSRLALGAIVIVALPALALTFSRGGYLGLVVALAVLLFPHRHRLLRRQVALIAMGVAASVLAVALALPAGRAIVTRVAERVVTSDPGAGSIRMHLDSWRVGAAVALDNPWLGTGPETFPLVFQQYLEVLPPDRAQFLGRFRLESPHNELIGVAAEVGLPALAAYATFLVACALVCVRRARAGVGASRSISLVVLAVLATHVVTNFFMTPEVSTSELFWVLMGAGLGAMGTTAAIEDMA